MANLGHDSRGILLTKCGFGKVPVRHYLLIPVLGLNLCVAKTSTWLAVRWDALCGTVLLPYIKALANPTLWNSIAVFKSRRDASCSVNRKFWNPTVFQVYAQIIFYYHTVISHTHTFFSFFGEVYIANSDSAIVSIIYYYIKAKNLDRTIRKV